MNETRPDEELRLEVDVSPVYDMWREIVVWCLTTTIYNNNNNNNLVKEIEREKWKKVKRLLTIYTGDLGAKIANYAFINRAFTSKELQSKLGISRQTVSHTLNNLIEAGLIEKKGKIKGVGTRRPVIYGVTFNFDETRESTAALAYKGIRDKETKETRDLKEKYWATPLSDLVVQTLLPRFTEIRYTVIKEKVRELYPDLKNRELIEVTNVAATGLHKKGVKVWR